MAASLLLASLLAAGCAHQRAAPPSEPTVAQPAADAATPGASGGASSGGSLDPSEVITSEELATIPDPVPGETSADPEPPTLESPPTASPFPASEGTQTEWIWRVQIFASPDRAQAERTAREASERLGESYVIDHEGSLYKVRLGTFSKESDAEPLKRRAVIEGYTGAFRVRTAKP